MPSSTVENYLKAILGLGRHGAKSQRVPLGRVAEQLAVTPGTVTTMMKNLAGKGWVDYEIRRGVRLTPKGRRHAAQVLRRHRLIERFLVDVVGMDWAQVHHEAEVLEHAVSDQLLERMDEMLGFPDRDPHGDPIPSAEGTIPEQDLVPLSDCAAGGYRVVRVLGDEAAFLAWLVKQRLRPGDCVAVETRDDLAQTLLIKTERKAKPYTIGTSAAARLLVNPVGLGDDSG